MNKLEKNECLHEQTISGVGSAWKLRKKALRGLILVSAPAYDLHP